MLRLNSIPSEQWLRICSHALLPCTAPRFPSQLEVLPDRIRVWPAGGPESEFFHADLVYVPDENRALLIRGTHEKSRRLLDTYQMLVAQLQVYPTTQKPKQDQ